MRRCSCSAGFSPPSHSRLAWLASLCGARSGLARSSHDAHARDSSERLDPRSRVSDASVRAFDPDDTDAALLWARRRPTDLCNTNESRGTSSRLPILVRFAGRLLPRDVPDFLVRTPFRDPEPRATSRVRRFTRKRRARDDRRRARLRAEARESPPRPSDLRTSVSRARRCRETEALLSTYAPGDLAVQQPVRLQTSGPVRPREGRTRSCGDRGAFLRLRARPKREDHSPPSTEWASRPRGPCSEERAAFATKSACAFSTVPQCPA